MRVISMVPSLTETFIECGVQVVGRTRYCIHPKDIAHKIPVVGGTKDLDWDKVKNLRADLLIVDKEENLPWMQSDAPLPVFVSHAEGIEDMPKEFLRLSETLQNQGLQQLSRQWQEICERPSKSWDWQNIPSTLEVWRRDLSTYEKLSYVIWKNPWMSVAKPTFIGSVLSKLGAEKFILKIDDSKYPKFEIEKMDLEKTLFLFSSEPFPFQKFKDEILSLGLQSLLVNGESYSWFGLRSLRFLQLELGIKK